MNSKLIERGARFRSKLSAADIQQIRRARNIFLTSQIGAFILYQLKTSEERPKFPCTISCKKLSPLVKESEFYFLRVD